MEPERRRGAKTIFTMLKKWKPAAGEFFDVGASFGWLVEEGVKSGWKGSGVDPSAKAVAEAQRRGLDVMLGFFPQDAPAGKKWDVVTITDVVEHLEDPRAIIRDVRERLKEDGILVIQSPDVTGLLHRTAALLSEVTLGRMNGPLARLWQVQFPYPHLHGFTRRNACRMLEACGFEVLEAVAQPIISGNMAKRAGYTKSSGGLDLVSRVYGLGIGTLNAVSALTGRQDLFLVIARRRDG
jgi:SAM-dependent methyltransferase